MVGRGSSVLNVGIRNSGPRDGAILDADEVGESMAGLRGGGAAVAGFAGP